MKLSALALLATGTSALRLKAHHKVPTYMGQTPRALVQASSKISGKAMSKARSLAKQDDEDPCGCGEDPVCWTMCVFDGNGDDVITMDEAVAGAAILAEHFGEPAATEDEVAEVFAEFDLDDDGVVTKDEVQAVFDFWIPMLEGIYEYCGEDEQCWEEALEWVDATLEKCEDDEACWGAEIAALEE